MFASCRNAGACGAPLAAVRADDAPPYFTIFITAHIIIALVVLTTHDSALPVWSMILGFVPLTLVIALLLLRPVKGAVVGVMLKLGLIGEPPRRQRHLMPQWPDHSIPSLLASSPRSTI